MKTCHVSHDLMSSPAIAALLAVPVDTHFDDLNIGDRFVVGRVEWRKSDLHWATRRGENLRDTTAWVRFAASLPVQRA